MGSGICPRLRLITGSILRLTTVLEPLQVVEVGEKCVQARRLAGATTLCERFGDRVIDRAPVARCGSGYQR